MSGGLRHHTDEENGPEPCGWTQIIEVRKIVTPTKGPARSALTRHVCSKLQKQKHQVRLTRPTSLEMSKTSGKLAKNGSIGTCYGLHKIGRRQQFSGISL